MRSDQVLAKSSHPYNKWLNAPQSARDRIANKVVIPYVQPTFDLRKEDSIFAVGSCFARNVEEYLSDCGCNVESNSFDMPLTTVETGRRAGIFNKYNPLSILQELEWANGTLQFPTESLIEVSPGQYFDPFLRAKAQTGSLDEVLARRQGIAEYFKKAFSSDLVIITLGLVETWFDDLTGAALNEAPPLRVLKKNPERYSFRRLGYDEAHRAVTRCVELLSAAQGSKSPNILITVSPVALGRTFTDADVIIANHMSKFTLHSVATSVCAEGKADYFPSFDAAMVSDPAIVFMDDRLHVSESMVGVIIRTFLYRYGLTTEDPLATIPEVGGAAQDADTAVIKHLRKDNDRLRTQLVGLQNKLSGQ